MKKTLGRLAGAVLAGALLTLTVSPAAFAQEAPAGTTEAAPTSEAPPSTGLPTSTPVPTSEQPTSQQPTSEPPTSQPPTSTGTGTPTSGKPTKPTTPTTEPTTEPTDPFPHGDDYVDDVAYAWEFDGGLGVLVIACAVGEPKNVVSNDFSVAAGPFQDGADGRYWGFDIQLNEGKHLTDDTTVSWSCEGKPVTRPVGHGGGSATVGGQVKVTPKAGGVETGGGATARS
ncbi:hypothetical protein [Amycolatopsis plumensis]|uniref:Uncharacterized protein n=1 Tax=Amycolatopsis plumensis TaxID=236508 RepID=A0ABV5UG88_9PSEU